MMIGPMPPPLGGVSVYVSRFAKKLERDGDTVTNLDYGAMDRLHRSLALARIAFSGHDQYHVHCTSIALALLFMITGKASRTRYTVHSDTVRRWSPPRTKILRAFMQQCNEIIWVGKHLAKSYEQHLDTRFKNGHVESSFLPPPEEDEDEIIATYSSDILNFIDKSDPLIVANAYRIEFHESVDLYGIDMCIDLVKALKSDYPNIGLLFALAEIGDYDYYSELRNRIKHYDLSDNFHFMTDQRELWPIFKRANLMVRPTNKDGFGISVAEALHLGCPAIASDVCKRAKGTILFKSRDMDDLLLRVREVLARKNPPAGDSQNKRQASLRSDND